MDCGAISGAAIFFLRGVDYRNIGDLAPKGLKCEKSRLKVIIKRCFFITLQML